MRRDNKRRCMGGEMRETTGAGKRKRKRAALLPLLLQRVWLSSTLVQRAPLSRIRPLFAVRRMGS